MQAAAHVDCFHPVAHTRGSSNSVIAGRGKNVTYLAESVLLLWGYTRKQMSGQTQNYTHTLFTTAPKHSSLSHILRNDISHMRPTNQQCMTATESRSLKMPDGLIAASPLTKADCQRPPFDICMGLVTRNVGIIHITLT